MKNLSSKWQKLIVWLTGYVNIIAFFLAGGYIFLKTDDEDVKTSAKTALVLTVFFTVVELVRSVIYSIMSLSEAPYTTLNNISKVATVFSIIKIVAFIALAILDLCGIKLIPVKNKASQNKTEEDKADLPEEK